MHRAQWRHRVYGQDTTRHVVGIAWHNVWRWWASIYGIISIKFNPNEFYWILKMPTEFILKFGSLILTDKLQPHFFTVTETLNSDQSDSDRCYSGSESATAHCSHSTVVSAWMFSSLLTKHVNSRQTTPFTWQAYMTSLPLWGKRHCAKSENLPTQKS